MSGKFWKISRNYVLALVTDLWNKFWQLKFLGSSSKVVPSYRESDETTAGKVSRTLKILPKFLDAYFYVIYLPVVLDFMFGVLRIGFLKKRLCLVLRVNP